MLVFKAELMYVPKPVGGAGAAEGRLQKVIANIPRRNRAYTRDFLQKLDPLQAVMGEVVAPEPWTPSVSTCLFEGDGSGGEDDTPTPIVLFSRYRDNVYIAFINVPPCMNSQVCSSVAVVLRCIYGIPLKWEPHGTSVTWGEASLTSCGDGFSLTCKGIVRDLSLYDPAALGEWTRWVHRFSPNARTVWRSQFPSIVLKSIWYALSMNDLRLNVPSLIWGMGYHSYPKRWWRPKLFSLWSKYRMGRCFSMHEVDLWFSQGVQISGGVAGVDGLPER